MPQALRDVPQEAVDLIKAFEGIPDGDPSTVNIDAYLCPANVWTIGWGHAIMDGGVQLKGAGGKAKARALFPGGITREQAEALLRGDLIPRAAQLCRLLKVEVSDAQFGALMALLFNIGGANLAASTLLRKLNAGDVNGAADQFLAWDKARVNGVLQALAGLTRRRRAERAMFLGQEWRTIAGVTRSRSRGAAIEVLPVPEMPAEDRAAMKKQAVKRAAAKKLPAKKAPARAALNPRGRTTAPKAPSPRSTAKRPAPRTAR
jgi:lysozyme